VESCLSDETGADEEWATDDETEELTEPQLPASGLHPVPQWSVEAPQYPYWEQHSAVAPSCTKPTQVKPEEAPHDPSVEVVKAPVG
jgi:hypothetical protein